MPAIVFTLLIVACDAGLITMPETNDALMKLSDEELKKLSMELFADKVQPVVASLKCPTCHTQVVGQNPFFADNSVDVSFPAIEPKVNMTDIESSSILGKIRSGHNCSVAGCEADAKKLLEGLKAWHEGLASVGATGEQYDLETTRLFPNTNTVTSYDIGKLIDEQYDDQFSLIIDMKKTKNNSYQLNDLTIAINDDKQRLFMKGIKILVNGSTFGKTELPQPFKKIACAALPGQSLSESVTTIVLDKTRDKLSFAFEEIRLANDDDRTCYSERAMEKKFKKEIKPILEEHCGECHDADPPRPDASNFLNFNEAKDKRKLLEAYLTSEKENHPGNEKIEELKLSKADDHKSIVSWLKSLDNNKQ